MLDHFGINAADMAAAATVRCRGGLPHRQRGRLSPSNRLLDSRPDGLVVLRCFLVTADSWCSVSFVGCGHSSFQVSARPSQSRTVWNIRTARPAEDVLPSDPVMLLVHPRREPVARRPDGRPAEAVPSDARPRVRSPAPEAGASAGGPADASERRSPLGPAAVRPRRPTARSDRGHWRGTPPESGSSGTATWRTPHQQVARRRTPPGPQDDRATRGRTPCFFLRQTFRPTSLSSNVSLRRWITPATDVHCGRETRRP